ncbi:MAG: hypothetical protein HRT53_06860 [Colwellia sp.]|nr:hypothetical protein [Colwellia sp.]
MKNHKGQEPKQRLNNNKQPIAKQNQQTAHKKSLPLNESLHFVRGYN